MNRTFTIFLYVVFSYSVKAQPLFNSMDVPAIGSTVSVKMISDPLLNPGPSGSNQIWDFSSLDFPAGASSTQVVDPASTNYASLFSQSNRAEFNNAGDYLFFNMATTGQTLYGLVENTQQVTIVYSDPLVVIKMPIAFNESQADDYSGSYTKGGLPVTMEGSATMVFDGYGTLKTPMGEFLNVARFKQTKEETHVTSVGPLTSTIVSNTVTYSWNLLGSSRSLFSIIDVNITNNGTPVESSKRALLFGSTTTAVNGSILKDLKIDLAPNPVLDNLTLDFKEIEAGEFDIQLTDDRGAISLIEKIAYSTGQKHTINLSGLYKGTYILTLRNAKGTWSEKIVKIQ